MCMNTWEPEVYTGTLPLLFFILYFETKSLTVVNLNCHSDVIENHWRDGPVGISCRVVLIRLTDVRRLTHCR